MDHLSEGVGCFDPIQVICRLRVAFPEIVEHLDDPLWKTRNQLFLNTQSGSEAAVRVATRDIQERGPKILFEIPVTNGRSIKGTAERYWVLVTSEEDFPEEFRIRFTTFLNGLVLQPIQVSSETS